MWSLINEISLVAYFRTTLINKRHFELAVWMKHLLMWAMLQKQNIYNDMQSKVDDLPKAGKGKHLGIHLSTVK